MLFAPPIFLCWIVRHLLLFLIWVRERASGREVENRNRHLIQRMTMYVQYICVFATVVSARRWILFCMRLCMSCTCRRLWVLCCVRDPFLHPKKKERCKGWSKRKGAQPLFFCSLFPSSPLFCACVCVAGSLSVKLFFFFFFFETRPLW